MKTNTKPDRQEPDPRQDDIEAFLATLRAPPEADRKPLADTACQTALAHGRAM